MSVLNRKDVRTAVKDSIDAALVGPSKVAQMCYKFQTGEFDEVIPSTSDVANVAVYVVTSSGSDRSNESVNVMLPEQKIYLDIHSFVLYEKEGEWSESESEDKIDDMEVGIINWWGDNADRKPETSPPWLEAHLMGRSEITSAFIGGIEYRHEVFSFGFLVGNPS